MENLLLSQLLQMKEYPEGLDGSAEEIWAKYIPIGFAEKNAGYFGSPKEVPSTNIGDMIMDETARYHTFVGRMNNYDTRGLPDKLLSMVRHLVSSDVTPPFYSKPLRREISSPFFMGDNQIGDAEVIVRPNATFFHYHGKLPGSNVDVLLERCFSHSRFTVNDEHKKVIYPGIPGIDLSFP